MRRLGFVAGLAVLEVVGLTACGRLKGAEPDGGDGASGAAPDGDDGAPGEVASAGVRAYDVTATLTVTPVRGQGGSWTDFPTTFRFTFVWDRVIGTSFTGGHGTFGSSDVFSADNRTFRVQRPLVASEAFATACDGNGMISLSDVTFSLDGDTLHGQASGMATYATNAATFSAPVTAGIVGTPDVTPPTLTSPGTAVNPLADLIQLGASEPLPNTGAFASLISSPHGDTIRLQSGPIDLLGMAIGGFVESDVVLRYGETYTLATDHLADFAGHELAAAVTFTTRAAPPLVPEDGFESVTGTMFGGAGVLRGGPLPPIAGQTSLLLNTGYGGGFGFLPYDLGPSLAVRLAVAPGDTVIRFDSQLIAPDPIDAASFVGELRAGSVGGTRSTSGDIADSGFAKVTLPQLGDVYMSQVKTITLPLPPDATGEITFEIVGLIDLCTQPPPPTVLVIDNLRVE